MTGKWISRLETEPWRTWLVALAVMIGPTILIGRELIRNRVLFWGTPALQFVPWWQEGLRQFLTGDAALWNMLNGMGAPLLANYQTAFFYPPNWLLVLFFKGWGASGLAWGFTFLAGLHLIWGGFGMAMLLRRLNASLLAQAVGGTAFALCGYWIGRLEFFSMIWAGAWIPWLLRYVDEIASPVNLMADTEHRKWFQPKLVFVLIMLLLAGHAQLSWYALELAGVWLVAGTMLRAGWRELPGTLGRIIAAVLIAAGAAAVQLIPTAEYLLQSQRASTVEQELALTYSFWPWRIISLFAPDFFGNPGKGNFWGYASYWEDHAYLGVLLVLMGIGTISILFNKRDTTREGWLPKPAVWLLWGVIIVSIVLAMGFYTPIFPFLFKHVPSFNMFQAPARSMIWLDFALIILGVYGIDRWKYPTGRGLYWLRLGTVALFQAGLDIAAHRGRKFFVAALTPVFGFAEITAAQEPARVAAAALPLAQSAAQPFLPAPKFVVILDPATQPRPVVDQRLMRHGHRFHACCVAVGDEQACAGEPLHQRPVIWVQVGARDRTWGVGRKVSHLQAADRWIADLHHVEEDVPCARLVIGPQLAERPLAIACQRAADPAYLRVRGVRQPAVRLPLPEQGQRELQQREVPRLRTHILQQAFQQSRLQAHAFGARRLDDGALQLVPAHRPQNDAAILQRFGQRAMDQRLRHKIGAQRGHADDRRVALFCAQRRGVKQGGG